jgi:hypothetical protein
LSQLDELLADRGRAADDAAVTDPLAERAHGRERIHPGMMEEAGVLGGEGGEDDTARNVGFGEWARDESVGGRSQSQRSPVSIEDFQGRLGDRGIGEALRERQERG